MARTVLSAYVGGTRCLILLGCPWMNWNWTDAKHMASGQVQLLSRLSTRSTYQRNPHYTSPNSDPRQTQGQLPQSRGLDSRANEAPRYLIDHRMIPPTSKSGTCTFVCSLVSCRTRKQDGSGGCRFDCMEGGCSYTTRQGHQDKV
ncbi:hypothetical protein BJ508DRAFT_75811 [Ascobolus immersus RN42]|uniref:Uncharacterized protein n=1 Tax=Ascobolus immersus RN42 TaxID=1160509 RepID=A0A3N4HHV8_ASCIM|nr:hypothetical protein BJ508DRAFT_75811 [Ascobolus immersus RN42]